MTAYVSPAGEDEDARSEPHDAPAPVAGAPEPARIRFPLETTGRSPLILPVDPRGAKTP